MLLVWYLRNSSSFEGNFCDMKEPFRSRLLGCSSETNSPVLLSSVPIREVSPLHCDYGTQTCRIEMLEYNSTSIPACKIIPTSAYAYQRRIPQAPPCRLHPRTVKLLYCTLPRIPCQSSMFQIWRLLIYPAVPCTLLGIYHFRSHRSTRKLCSWFYTSPRRLSWSISKPAKKNTILTASLLTHGLSSGQLWI
ncbi:hypothetical protein ABKN59_007973 [Abortiporus biennis]